MRILFISYYLPPLLYPQSIQIGRFLYYLKQYEDLEIVVITADDESNEDKNLYPDIFEDLEVFKVKNSFNIYINYVKNRFLPFIYQRPDSFKSWMDRAYKEITKKYKNFDAILTFSYPLSTNLLGMKLKEFYKSKWIAHNSDPWADNPHLHIPNYLKNYHQALEKKVFNKADKLLFTSLETSEFYKNKYPNLDINFINHSFDKTLYPKLSTLNSQSSVLIFRYIGSFYGSRTPKPLFEAMKLMNEKELSQFEVELIGGGKKAEFLLKEYNFQNVKVLPPVSYLKSLELMKNSDCLLVIDAPSEDKSIFFPSKLADYIGSEVPIFGISPKGTTNRILKELNYPCFELDEIENIKKRLLNMIQFQYKNKNIDNYDIKINIDKLKGFICE